MRFKISLFLICLLALSFAVEAFGEEGVVKITELSGKVLVKTPSTGWAEAEAGQPVKQKDSVKTEAESLAMLQLPDNSTVTLKPNSEITIEELLSDGPVRKTMINMAIGQIRAIVTKLEGPSEFKIKTPIAISVVRGTIEYFGYNTIDATLFTDDGIVDFISTISPENRTVVKGMLSIARKDGTISLPRAVTKEERDKIISGWDIGLTAEPYAEPPDRGGTAADIEAPEVREESAASTI